MPNMSGIQSMKWKKKEYKKRKIKEKKSNRIFCTKSKQKKKTII